MSRGQTIISVLVEIDAPYPPGGLGHDLSQLRPFWSQFADMVQVIFLDQLSNGRSDWARPTDCTLDRWADEVYEFCMALKIKKPIVMGVSFGASIAMNYARRRPEHPGKLTLISAAGWRQIDRIPAVYERLGGLEVREVARLWNQNAGMETAVDFTRFCFPLYFRVARPTLEIVARISNHNLVLWWERETERFRDLLPAPSRGTCRTPMMGGEDDPQTPIDDQADSVAAPCNAPVRFEWFVGYGHGGFPDQPERCAQIIREFIAVPLERQT
jgi:pimeloyl-ACP methyl ester carboxylesterase